MSHCFLDNMVMSSPRLHHGQSCQQHHRRIAYSDECSFSYAARCIYPTPYSVSALPYMAFSPHIPQSLISSPVGHFSLMYPARLSINASYQTEQSALAFPRSRSLPNPKRCESRMRAFPSNISVAWSVAVATAALMQPAVFAARVSRVMRAATLQMHGVPRIPHQLTSSTMHDKRLPVTHARKFSKLGRRCID